MFLEKSTYNWLGTCTWSGPIPMYKTIHTSNFINSMVDYFGNHHSSNGAGHAGYSPKIEFNVLVVVLFWSALQIKKNKKKLELCNTTLPTPLCVCCKIQLWLPQNAAKI